MVAEVREAIGLGNADRRGRLPGNLLQPRRRRRRGPRPTPRRCPADRRPAGRSTWRTQTASPSTATTLRPGPRRTRSRRRSAACPGRRSASPRRPATSSSDAPIGSGRVSGDTPNRSFSRIRASAALVREPSSSAKRADPLDGHAAVELHAPHRRRRRRCRRRRRSRSRGWRAYSIDGIIATSSCPAASASASRLGRSTTISSLRGDRGQRERPAAGRSGTSPRPRGLCRVLAASDRCRIIGSSLQDVETLHYTDRASTPEAIGTSASPADAAAQSRR